VKLRRAPANAIPLPLPGLEEPAPAELQQTQPQPKPIVDEPDPVPAPAPSPFQVRVLRSARRRRTSSARLIGDILEIRLPSWMTAKEEAHWVAEWTRRFIRKASTDRIDLPDRAALLARRYDLPAPAHIAWVDGMRTRWGSCTPAAGTIRISSALAPFPDWVLDYVIVHELAHLREHGHTAAFWELIGRFPRAERARGYLMAKSGEEDEGSW